MDEEEYLRTLRVFTLHAVLFGIARAALRPSHWSGLTIVTFYSRVKIFMSR